MKILYVTTIGLTLNTFLVPHILELVRRGHKVDCACNIDRVLDKELEGNKVVTHNIKFSRNPFNKDNLQAIKEIKELQEKNNYDVVHVHTPIASFITRYALKNYKVKVIYTCHGFHFYSGASIINWILYYPVERISAKWTDRIITINNEDFKRAKSFKLRNKGEVLLMHGVGINPTDYEVENFDKDTYRKQFGVEKDDFMILMLAEINKNKNHIQIIKAIEMMEDKSKVKVICGGSGPLEESLKAKVQELKLDENIKFIGYRNDIKELLNSCDCVALLSKREGLGKCLLEGMLLNKKIIATKTRGSSTLLGENSNAFCEIDNYRSTKELIERLMTNDINCEKYILNNILKDVETYNL